MSKNQKKVSIIFNWTIWMDHFLILVSGLTGHVSIFAFASLFGVVNIARNPCHDKH